MEVSPILSKERTNDAESRQKDESSEISKLVASADDILKDTGKLIIFY